LSFYRSKAPAKLFFLLDHNKDSDVDEEDGTKSQITTSEVSETKDINASRKNSVFSQRNDSPMGDGSDGSNHNDDGVGTLSRQSSIISSSISRRESSSGISVESSTKSNGNQLNRHTEELCTQKLKNNDFLHHLMCICQIYML